MLRDAAKSFARSLGLELRRFAPVSSYTAQLKAMLSWHRVDLIFDVGANTGQFGRELRRQVGFTGRIVSFEPTSAAHERLSAQAGKDPLWDVAPRVAIGAQEGMVTINVACNSVSSSVLPMLENHARAAPDSLYTDTETVRLATLDSLTAGYFVRKSSAFLKVDTQGYESEVLKGAPLTLARVIGVQLELSLIPLYTGQLLMPELLEFMREAGFDLWAITPAFTDPRNGRLLQVDAAFFRRVPPSESGIG
jgi:FkbM family methyltransferase